MQYNSSKLHHIIRSEGRAAACNYFNSNKQCRQNISIIPSPITLISVMYLKVSWLLVGWLASLLKSLVMLICLYITLRTSVYSSFIYLFSWLVSQSVSQSGNQVVS